tara:strand:- start:92 stop:433 length:342 start_codon:yes stop_codon:yes gene_type:complete
MELENKIIMSKTTPKINKGTIIELIYDDKKDLIKLAEKSEFCEFILKDSLKAIEKAIKYKLPKVNLFNIANLSIVIELDKLQYKSVLTQAEKFYANMEDYEECSRIKKLIDKL